MSPAKQKRGSVLIELALVMTIFVPLMLGAVHFGYLFYLYNGLEKSIRDGARYAASRTYVTQGAYEDVIKSVVVCGSWNGTCGTTGGPQATVVDLTTSMVSVTPIFGTGGRPARVRIAIQNYPYRGVLSSVLNSNTGGVLYLSKPSVEFPYFGRYAPPE